MKKMKKTTLLVLAFLLIISCSVSANDFRNTSWGMSKAEVKEAETKVLEAEKENLLVYQDKVLGFPTGVSYIFAKGKLVRAKYFIIESHVDKNDYISDYATLFEALRSKYGNKYEDHHYWDNELFKKYPKYWGLAVSLGHHYYYSKWKTDTTSVLLYLKGQDYKTNLGIEYSSRELQKLEYEVKNEEIEQKL